MDVYVLGVTYTAESTAFTPIAIIDSFKSLIWTKRYYTHGDFELYVPADDSLIDILKPRNWLIRDDDPSVMLIENISIETDAENGDYFIVSGRSLECILSFRVIAPQLTVNESDVIQAIKLLITRSTSGMRVFPSFTIDDSFEYAEEISTQFTGQNLLDTISTICQQYGIGFRISLSGRNIVLSFYQGEQVDVIFSPEYDNLINSRYVYDVSNYANFAIVAGEGEGTARKLVSVLLDPSIIYSGFARREIFVDARDVSTNEGEISTSEYENLLTQRGRAELAEKNVTKTFESEIEPSMTYTYKVDYNLGDIVTVTNEYGVTSNPRIVEIIESWDDTGYKVVPTFDALEVQ